MTTHRARPLLSCLLAALSLCAGPGLLAAAALPAAALAAPAVPLDLPAQPLDASLAAVARATGLDLVWDPALTAGKQAPALAGAFTREEALARLLAGSGLAARFSGEGRAVLAPAPPPPAPAPATPPAAPKASPQRAELEEVGVTGERERTYTAAAATSGTKTATPLLETPVSVQVVPAEVLQDQAATTLDRALRNVSGVRSRSQDGNNELVLLRGFSTTTTFRNGFRVDEFVGSGLRALYDVERVEVLKGPAAILYGRVEPGGLVNLVTRRPRPEAEASAELRGGSWDHLGAVADATGPLDAGGRLLYLATAAYERGRSFREGLHDEHLFLAPQLQWRPGERTQVTLEAEYHRNDTVTDSLQVVPYDPVTNQVVDLPRNRNLAGPQGLRFDTFHAGLILDHRLDAAWSIRAQLIQHAAHVKGTYYQPVSATQVPGSWTIESLLTQQDVWQSTTAAILDVTGRFETGGLGHTLLLGADYYRWSTPLQAAFSSDLASTDAFQPTRPSVAIDPTTGFTAAATTHNLGVYAQDQVKLPFGLHALGGVRFQYVTRTGSLSAGGDTFPDPKQEDHAFTPRGALLWRPAGWLSLWGSYAENFGANTGRDRNGAALPPEKAQQLEGGARAQWLDGKLTASLAWYDLTKQNVPATDPVDGISRVVIGEIRSRGPELDLQGEPWPGWRLTASYAYTDAAVTKSTPGSQFVEGNRMPDVPWHMASLWATHDFQAAALRGLKLGAGVSWRGATTDVGNVLDSTALTLVDAMAGYELHLGGRRLTAQLNVANLLDRRFVENRRAFDTYATLTYGAPRTLSASVKLDL